MIKAAAKRYGHPTRQAELRLYMGSSFVTRTRSGSVNGQLGSVSARARIGVYRLTDVVGGRQLAAPPTRVPGQPAAGHDEGSRTSSDRRPAIDHGSGAAKQVRYYFAGPLVAARGELLQPLRVLVLDAENDRELGVGVANVGLDVPWVDRGQVGVEVAGLRIGLYPGIVGHGHLSSSLRSRAEESQPVTISQVVGSTVCSITSVSTRPPSVRPISSRRLPGDASWGLRTTT